jgi:DNA-binding NarL/FixJ family response regulator
VTGETNGGVHAVKAGRNQEMTAVSSLYSAVLVDDQRVWLDALGSIVQAAGIQVVGTATSADEAFGLLEETNPSLLVSELRLPAEMSGGELVREAIKRRPELHAVILSGDDDTASIGEALSSGADVFVSKKSYAADITVAIKQVFTRSFFLAPRAWGENGQRERAERLPSLTRREREILALVSEGHSNPTMARMLWLTEQTVKFHLCNIYRKLGVANRTAAARWAIQQQIAAASEVVPLPTRDDQRSLASGLDAAGRTNPLSRG